MKKFLVLDLLLLLGLILGWAVVEALVFHHVDLRFEGVFSLVVVPALQAVVLRLVMGPSVLISLREAGRDLATSRKGCAALLSFLMADIVIVSLGWFLARHPALGFVQPRSLQPLWAEWKGVVAAGGFAWLAWKFPRGRLSYALVAAGLLGLSVDHFFPWLYRLPPAVLPRSPKLFQWMLSYGVLFLCSLTLLLRSSGKMQTVSAAGRLCVETATGIYFVIAVIVILGAYLRPELPYLWKAVVDSGESLMMTFLAASAYFSLAPRRR